MGGKDDADDDAHDEQSDVHGRAILDTLFALLMSAPLWLGREEEGYRLIESGTAEPVISATMAFIRQPVQRN